MWKYLLIAGLGPLILAWAGRRWLWEQVKHQWLSCETSKSQAQMREAMGLTPAPKQKAVDAARLGISLRESGLELLEREGDSAAKARRKGMWLLRILPVLVALIAVFGMMSHRIRPGLAISGGIACVGLLVLIRLLGLTVELRGVMRGTQELRRIRFFNRVSEEEAVLAAAKRSIWLSVWPW